MFILVFVCLTLSLQAQVKTDTLLALNSLNSADSLIAIGAFEEGKDEAKKAAELFLKAESWERYLEAMIFVVQSYNGLSQIDSSFNISKKTTIKAESLPGIRPRTVALCYKNLGQGFLFYKSDYDSAILYLTKSIDIYKEAEDNTSEAVVSVQLGNVYNVRFDNKKARFYYNRALEVYKEKYQDGHIRFGTLYNSLGISYGFYGAIDYDLALEYFQRSLSILKKFIGESHPFNLKIYSNIASMYEGKRDFKNALTYFNKALSLSDKTYGELSYDKAVLHGNIASLHAKRGENKLAEQNFERSINILLKMGAGQKSALSDQYLSYSDWLASQNRYEEAIQFIDQILMSHDTESEQLLIPVYNVKAKIYIQLQKIDSALQEIQNALIVGVENFDNAMVLSNPSVTNNPLNIDLVESFGLKANLFFDKWEEEKSEDFLLASLDAIIRADSMISRYRYQQTSQDDKLRLSKQVSTYYQLGLEVAYELFELTEKDEFKQKAFFFAERSKAAVLSEALNDLEAKAIARIPEDILQFEQELKINKQYYLTKINEFPADSAVNWHQKLFHNNRQFDSLINTLENTFPHYYELKYNSKYASLRDVHNHLGKHTAVLEFFETDEKIFVFLISKDQQELIKLNHQPVTNEEMLAFRNALKADASDQSEKFFKEYISMTRRVYKLYFEDALNTLSPNVDKLVVIPDGSLNYLPADLLLSEDLDQQVTSFADLPYLLNKYQIAYHYSSSEFLRKKVEKVSDISNRLIAYAPQYNSGDKKPGNTGDHTFRDEFSPLAWNQNEALEIAEKLNGEAFLGEKAGEKEFRENLGNSEIIHLAMHAVTNDKNPINSKLIFYDQIDSLNDGFLHAYEIYNMVIPAKLIVLSACETGFGKLSKGEGLMSLARAFSYSGTNSIVMSHWSADDQSTSEIMIDFYDYINQGETISQALRQAKIKFLQESSPNKVHPFFWGTFVSIGQDKQIIESSNMNLAMITVVVLLILVVTFLIYRKKSIA